MNRNHLTLTVLLASLVAMTGRAAVTFPRGDTAFVVASPQTDLEKRVLDRLTNYTSQVSGKPVKVVASLQKVPAEKPAFVLVGINIKSPFKVSPPTHSPEAFTIETGVANHHDVVVMSGHTERGLKRAVQRLIIASEQRESALVIPETHQSESPWIVRREWTICPWTPNNVQGSFYNEHADNRPNIWLYSDEQVARYVEMFDWFGFSGCQLMETCYSYSLMGSPEAFQSRQKRFAECIRANGQDVTLWVWAMEFNKFGWVDPDVTYIAEKGKTAFEDPKVRAGFEKYYNHYAKLAPEVDLLIAHCYDPGALTNRADVFQYMRLLRDKFRAQNPKVEFAVDFWAAGSPAEYMQQLIDNGFGDSLLLESSLPHLFPPGKREALHEEAKKRNLKLGVWGWYTAEMESDQMPMFHVNAQLLKDFYGRVKNGAHQVQPLTYWSEMEAYHLLNIFTMYASSQLLWNPDRDPHEILREIAEGIWGPRNGPTILEVLELVQDVRSGPTWDTYWWRSGGHRLGTDYPEDDLRRTEIALSKLEQMKTDERFVPKLPLPFPPQTFVELIIPHLKQIRHFAEFRIEVAKVRAAAHAQASKEELTRMARTAWKPVPEFNTWIGTFGQAEALQQEIILQKLAKELAIEIEPPEWLRARDADRLWLCLQKKQRSSPTVWQFHPREITQFHWTVEKLTDRVERLAEDGCVKKAGEDVYQLSNWMDFRQQ